MFLKSKNKICVHVIIDGKILKTYSDREIKKTLHTLTFGGREVIISPGTVLMDKTGYENYFVYDDMSQTENITYDKRICILDDKTEIKATSSVYPGKRDNHLLDSETQYEIMSNNLIKGLNTKTGMEKMFMVALILCGIPFGMLLQSYIGTEPENITYNENNNYPANNNTQPSTVTVTSFGLNSFNFYLDKINLRGDNYF